MTGSDQKSRRGSCAISRTPCWPTELRQDAQGGGGLVQKGQVSSDRKNGLVRRFVVAFVGFLIFVPSVAFTMAVLAAPSPQGTPRSAACAHALAGAYASMTAIKAEMKRIGTLDGPEICIATRLYFFEVVRTRTIAAICESDHDGDDVRRLDYDAVKINDAIAAHCL